MTVAIASVALALSFAAFLTGRWRDRRDLLLRVHEGLLAANQQRGRRLIYTMRYKNMKVEDLSDDEYVLINHALSSMHTMGMYYRRRYIRRKNILELWAVPVVRLLSAAESFLAYRDELIGRLDANGGPAIDARR